MVPHGNSGSADFRRCFALLCPSAVAVVSILSTCLMTNSLGRADKEMRLTDGEDNCSGRVEVKVQEEWGTVCNNGWGMDEVSVICRQLGCPTAIKAAGWANSRAGSGRIWMDHVSCRGNESALWDCKHDGWGKHNCSHQQDAGVTCSDGSSLEMRLMNGGNQCSGRIEVKFQGQWGTVCDDNFNIDHASVVCKQLECGSAVSFSGSANFGEGSGPIWFDDLVCSGNESALWNCKHEGWGKHNCDHAEDVGVICLDGADLSLRLVDGVTECSGRLEVKFQGEWGTVCDDGWDSNDAAVVCKQLGCPTAVTAIGRVNASEGSGHIWLDNLSCQGDESALWQCRHHEWGKHYCNHNEDAGVTCSDGSDLELRLVGGGSRCAGTVEVEIQKLLGKVCDRGWGLKEADVVCKQLGCGSALKTSYQRYSKVKATNTWLFLSRCSGNETSLWDCKNWQWGGLSCDHYEEAKVTCSVLDNLEQTTVSNFGPLESQPDFRTPEFEEFNGKHDSLFFNDGQRRIDFVLVYEDESRKETNKKGSNEKQRRKRQAYESNLICGGLQLEATRSVLDDKLIFVKVHAPWEVLCTYAEIMHIKLPLKPNDLKTRSSAFGNFSWFTKVLQVDESIIKPEQEFFTAPFEKNRMNDFYIHDRDTFFNPATRSRIVYFILSRIQYQVRDNVKKFGINKLVSSGIYKAAFPLHDCNFSQRSEDPSCPSERYLLYREWAHPRSIYKKQPLDLIRKYYGEKIGIYFAWLGYYTQMLFLAAIVGVACFLYGYVNQNNCTWSKEVCHPDIGGKIIMCPQCDKICPFWKLNSTCESSKKLCIFDSFGTLVFAVFMGVWVTLFLEFWKRRQAELEYEWDTVELQQEEQPRPEYEAQCTHVVINEITQEEEHVPFTTWGKCIRVTLCASAVLFWILLIIASVIGIIVYRLSVLVVFSTKLSQTFNGTDPIQKYLTPQTATSITASVISFIIIMILNTIYEKVAIMITNFELPRTQTDYENSLTMKMFLFQFVNYYSSCFYIAFFKGKFVGYPGDPTYWLGKYRNEECEPGGCLLELTTQLTIIMGGKAIWNNIQEVLLPWIKNLIGRYHTASRTEKKSPRWEQDYHLQLMGKLGLFYEYLEMIIQFGFVTLFVASFPLAPLLALVNNILEIRVDAWKMTTQYRRMVPEKAQDIGAWQPIMQGIAILAVVTNAMIIAFTSDMIPRLVYYWSFSVPPYGNHTQYTMEGYINSTLSYFNVSDFKSRSRGSSASDFDIRTCRYRDFRNPPGHPQEYKHNIYYWHVITAKLAFIIVMEHVIYSVKFFISYAIPDVSKRTKSKIKREKYLTQKLLHENHLKDMTKTMGVIAERMGPVVTDNNLRPKSE